MNNFAHIQQSKNIHQMSVALLPFWCLKCDWRDGRVTDCEEVCREAIQDWLQKGVIDNV